MGPGRYMRRFPADWPGGSLRVRLVPTEVLPLLWIGRVDAARFRCAATPFGDRNAGKLTANGQHLEERADRPYG